MQELIILNELSKIDKKTIQLLDAKYLKIFAKNYGKLPSWHEAAGAESWLFIDEIIVE